MKNKIIMKLENNIQLIIGIICLIMSVILLVMINNLNILPLKYFLGLSFVVILLNLVSIFCITFYKQKIRIIGYILIGLILISNCIGYYYIKTTDDFLNIAFNNINKYTNTFVVLSLNDDTSIDTLKNNKLGYYKEIPNVDAAITHLDTINTIEYNNINKMFEDLLNNNIKYILLENNLYNLIFELDKTLNKENYKIVYQFDLTFDEIERQNKENSDTFNIYVGGTDFTNQIYDFNTIITVNKKTHQILLTSIPRDYHIKIYGKETLDNINYHGVFGITTAVGSLEQLFDIKIDYYVKINTNSLVELVDLVDGLEYCSSTSFTTTHSTILNSYDDSKGTKLNVIKGCKKYTGIEILTIARERLNIVGSDVQRQKNCQAIMTSLFKKLVSPANLTNYKNILDSVSNLYSTNISRNMITKFIKDILDNNTKMDN